MYLGAGSHRAEVDLDDAVLAEVHDGQHRSLQRAALGQGEVAEEDRVLEPLPVGFHHAAYPPQAPWFGDVVGDEVAPAGHGVPQRVTMGTYSGNSPTRRAARIHAWTARTRGYLSLDP